MKILAKNFSGTTHDGNEYRINWEINKEYISLMLSFYNPDLDMYAWNDIITKSFDVDTFKDALRDTLIEAEQQWDIELLEMEFESKLTA